MNLTKRFIEHLKIDKGSSPQTRSAYEQDLKQFCLFLAPKKNAPPDPKNLTEPASDLFLLQVTENDFENFLKELKSREQKSTSIARKISALKQFYRFLLQENLISEDPTLFIQAPFLGKNLPKALDSSSILALLKTADVGLPYGGKFKLALQIRDRAMIYLLYATGMRVTELISLKTSNTDIESGHLRVLGKRNKERMIPFAPIAGEHLSAYLNEARPLLSPKSDHLFIGMRGEPLTRQAFWVNLKKLAQASGIPQNLHPHMLRHTFATDLLQAGMNLRSLQLLLGHADLQTTQIYTHVAPEQLKEVIKKYHPRGGG